MKCPWCGSPMEAKPEYNLNARHKKMFEAVVQAGPMGIDVDKFMKEFFKPENSPVTMRTTINRMNERIEPLRIVTRFGTLRISQ